VIVDAAWYAGGHRRLDTTSIRALAEARHRPGVAWLDLHEPTDAELDEVRDAFGIPELAIADARHDYDRPKVERHGECLLTVVPTVRYEDDRHAIRFGEVFLYAEEDYVVSVRLGDAAPLDRVRRRLEADPPRLAHGADALLQALLLHLVQTFEPVVDRLELDVRDVERDVFSEVRPQPTKRIYLLMREALDVLVAVEPMAPAVRQLTSDECMPWLDPQVAPLFRDVDDVLSTIVDRARAVHELLQNVLQASRAEADRQQNEDTRKISAWAAIGIVPTIVAGFFGMNLGGIPLADHPAGFAVVCALTLLACGGLFRLFKRAGWL
jgi:magnesium transporter